MGFSTARVLDLTTTLPAFDEAAALAAERSRALDEAANRRSPSWKRWRIPAY